MSKISLHDLIAEIHILDRKLHEFEMRFDLLSEDFYQLYENGSLRDENLEEIDSWGQWAALFRIRQRRIEQYNKLRSFQPEKKTNLDSIALTPHAITIGAG